MIDDLLTAVGLKKLPLIGGLLGSLVSLKHIDGIGEWSVWRKTTTVFSGALLAAYCAPLAIYWLELTSEIAPGVAFIFGLFGMSWSSAAITQTPEIFKKVIERFTK